MRAPFALVLCSCALLAGAQENAADPFLSLEIADVPALRALLAASWHGRAWALPQASPLRAVLTEALAEASRATTVPWDAIAAQVTWIRIANGRTTSVALTFGAPAAPHLAAVPEAARRIAERWQAHLAACRAWKDAHGGRDDGVAPPTSPGDIAAVVLTEGNIVVGRSQSYRPSLVMEDGWRLQAQDDALILTHPAAGAPTLAATKPFANGIVISVDVPIWAAAAGLPGISELLRACGVGRVDGTVTIAEGRSREQARLPRAALPLRTVDLAVLDRVVPADALALSAIGVDGARLATLADEVARQRGDLAPLITTLRPALAALDGTAWLAVLPGAEAPGVVIGIPANAGLDGWLARVVPACAAHLADAQRAPVAVEVARRLTVVVKRAADHWLIASDETCLAATDGGFIARQRATTTIPAAALALGIQDNPAVLRALVRYLPALAQVLRGLSDDLADCPAAIPAWMRNAKTQVAPLLEAAAAWAVVAEAPVSAVSLTMRDGDAILDGQDLAVGVLIAPVLAPTLMDLLPCLLPEWSRGRHLLHTASDLAGSLLWHDPFLTTYLIGASLDWLSWSRAQTNTLALSSPIPAARARALNSLSTTDDPVQTAWAFALCRRSLDDPDPAVRDGAWNGLCSNARGHRDEIDRLMVGFLDDADPHIRLRAVTSMEGTARTLRRARSLYDDRDWRPDEEPRFPAGALEPLLALEQRETDGEVLRNALVALSGFDDARVLPRLRARLDHPDPRVRTGAVMAIGYCPAADHDPTLVQAVARLLPDQAVGTEWLNSVGGMALETLGMLPGAETDTLLKAQFAAPDHPSPESTMLPSRHVRLMEILLRRGDAGIVTVIGQRLAQDARVANRLWNALGKSPLAEAEALLRAQLAGAPKDNARDELLMVLSERRERHGLQRETIAAIIALIATGSIPQDAPSLAVEVIAEVLRDQKLQPLVIPLLIPLLGSARQATRQAAYSLVEDLPPTAPGRADIAAAIAKAWTTYGAEAFPDHEPPPAPEPKPDKTSDF